MEQNWRRPPEATPSAVYHGHEPQFQTRLSQQNEPSPYNPTYFLLTGLLGGPLIVVDMVKGVLENASAAVKDPAGYVQQQVDMLTKMYEAIRTDPGGFAVEFGKDLIEYDLLIDKPGEWIGKWGCEIAIAVLTGGLLGRRSWVILVRFC